MLRCGAAALRLYALPSTSQAQFHTIKRVNSLPKAAPIDEELPENERVLSQNTSDRRKEILSLDSATVVNRRPRKKTTNIIVEDTHLAQWSKMEPNGLITAYLQLSKSKLTMLITTTAIAGCFMSPISPALMTAVGCAAGTTLLSSAANACNQLLEAPYDAQMRRTQSRVLVVHRFSPLHAFSFATLTSLSGAAILLATTNPLTAFLGALNVGLYAGVYTPLKRSHIACTWAGAVVGAIPPLMGYCSMTGVLDAGALCLGAILFSWQFPHFNGLSWNLRDDYSRAGYRVMCVTNERLCRVTSLRHSILLFALCSVGAPLTNLTTNIFAIDSIPLNLGLLYLSYKFYKAPDAKNSRHLFFFSLFYLPCIMGLMIIDNATRNSESKLKNDWAERIKLKVNQLF
ncbi:hypothetical protein WR25_17387 [Diploscapter pachys]|uniref:Protoheme IX farnesyltransferase, mitochondrial n=1 Tax=Diploscapter pachys TaxID=2018661 RepID=A0A2A2JE59_9BILA|nr:hypothetical protein WR25_17387 [Diploscapter pachys]